MPAHQFSQDSQPLFAFEWVDPETGSSNQLTWTRLPQGFKNSPTIFDEALHKDLSSFRIQHPRVTLLQYVDDLLLAADTKEDWSADFQWGIAQQKAFDSIKKALLSAPALTLPDVNKPFTLYIEERRGVARGVLTQALGPWKRPVAYLSKRLNSVASGWPRCLKAIVAAALLAKDADKLTLGQKLTIIAPHALESIIHQPPDRWMSNARITHYQSILLDKDRVTFGAPSALNPATLLPDETAGPVLHTCQEILAEETGIRRDLKDQSLPNSEVTWFSDGSSFLQHDTFSGWVEAYPTKRETAQVVVKKIMEEIFPRFGLPKVIGSDNGPAFVAQVSQGVARILGIDWKLHCAYRPQSSGQVKK
ncbi:uncharacterized protein LOC143653614 isoform X1 [Tamandua tetradactyla]|uniref:uncharacterized protein LOC143653614 isoform X1 n=1 Tax=Tamandua tetradactyla TaxID=48850 RepID=UPI004053F0C0